MSINNANASRSNRKNIVAVDSTVKNKQTKKYNKNSIVDLEV